MSDQWIRKAQLIVSSGTVGLDLSELRFRFQTRNDDQQTPNTLYVRVYNLRKDTAAKIGTEFKSITLQAGYVSGNVGIIFSGTIKETREGKERNVDSYVDIWAADGDIWYNGAIINQTLAAGATQQQIISAVTNAQSPNVPRLQFSDDTNGLIAGGALGTQQALSRGKVLFGLSRDYARDWAKKNGFRWSIQNGEFVVVPITGYRKGEAVVMSSTTGMIGIPEATDGGIRVRSLLNPLIRIGALVQIQQADINRVTTQQAGTKWAPATSTITTKQGFYRVMTAEFQGDTRGQDWYVDMVCLAVDVSAPDPDQSVSP